MELIFLGTGPTSGIKASGKSRRFESSVLLQFKTTSILIDVTNDFEKQSQLIKSLDAILITHAHKDAIGGMNQLLSWVKKTSGPIPLFSHPQTIFKIQSRFSKTSPLILTAIPDHQSFQIDAVKITPFLVKHSIQPGFPTFGYYFLAGDRKIAYVSDTGGWNKKAEKFLKSVDILIIDGAMWGKRMIAHLDIKAILPKFCSWSVKKIIFTQIGHTAPRHEILQKEIAKICPKALPAYDGMRLKT